MWQLDVVDSSCIVGPFGCLLVRLRLSIWTLINPIIDLLILTQLAAKSFERREAVDRIFDEILPPYGLQMPGVNLLSLARWFIRH